ncbi:hypothetical protein ASG00_09515 [Microbacterium sp. Leaf351]|nr:hypothetical protein ASG00_09515 [Microbacterium sp. Leaf351]
MVPAVAADWTHPPFAAEIDDDGYLYGRGVVDMKGFAGTLLALARHFRRNDIVPARDIVFAFVADEETGGVWGARWIVENRPDLLAGVTEAVSEVGGFSIPAGRRRAYVAAVGEKGVAWATLTARGRAAHGSRPTADNAVVRLARAVAALGDHPFPVERTEALDRFLRVYAAHTGEPFGDLSDALARLGHAETFLAASARDTVSPTVLIAGDKTNVIPAEARARLDIRVLPGHDDSLRAEITRIVGDDIDIRWGGWTPATLAASDSPLLDVFDRAIGAEDSDGFVVPYLLPASTDNKSFARLGIHGYGFVALQVPHEFDVFAQFHAADERVPVDALHFCTRVTERILRTA